jgi:hypothetical protein
VESKAAVLRSRRGHDAEAYAALIGAALLGLFVAGACDDDDVRCSDAASAADCEAIALPGEGNQCGWATIRRFSVDGSCAVEAEREACVEFAGTQAGCSGCGSTDDVGFARAEAQPGEVLVTTVCGPTPVGWSSCFDEPDSACECQGC